MEWMRANSIKGLLNPPLQSFFSQRNTWSFIKRLSSNFIGQWSGECVCTMYVSWVDISLHRLERSLHYFASFGTIFVGAYPKWAFFIYGYFLRQCFSSPMLFWIMINIGCDLGLVFRFINGQSIERFELLGILGLNNTKDTKLGRFYSLPHLSNHAVLFLSLFWRKNLV